jgi:hypothetical protein
MKNTTTAAPPEKCTFNGDVFTLNGKYFARWPAKPQGGPRQKPIRLHRAVWEFHNGAIPDGYDIHHIDDDRKNNDISNLECVQHGTHTRRHELERRANNTAWRESREAWAAKGRDVARAWHSTPDGRAWHSAQAKSTWAKRMSKTFTCQYCGVDFDRCHNATRYCTEQCGIEFRRARRQSPSLEVHHDGA